MKKALPILFVFMMVIGLLGLSACAPAQPTAAEAPQAEVAATTAPAVAATEAAVEAPTAAPTDVPAKKLKLGFSHCNLTIAWMAELQTHVKKEADALGIELIIANANDDKNKQVTDVENLLSQGIDGLLIVPVDSKAAVQLVDMAKEKNVPVTVASRAIANDAVVSFATGDDLEAGRMVGQYFADVLKGKGNVVLLEGPLGLNPVILRVQGFKEVLEKYPDIKIVAEQVADNNRAKAVSVMENILTANPEIDAVFGTNDEMALGSFISMKAVNREDEAKIATVGGQIETFTSIKNGEMSACVYYPSTMGAKALDLLVDHINGKEVPKKDVVPSALITVDNVDQYIAALQ